MFISMDQQEQDQQDQQELIYLFSFASVFSFTFLEQHISVLELRPA